MAHGRGEVTTATAIGVAAVKAVSRLSEEQRLLYSLLIEANLSEAARKAIEMQPGLEKYFSEAQRRNYERGRAEGEAQGKAEGEAKGKAEGEAKGKADAVLKILMRRGLTPSADQRRRIVACTDLSTLERWLERSLSASSVDELMASPSQVSRNGHRRGQAAAGSGRRKSR
jgi:predicted transposase YdaD